jgi:phosphoglycerate kinase
MIAVPFLRALGWRTGGTSLEHDAENVATELLELAEKEGVEIVLPTDVVCGDRVAQGAKVRICSARHILQGEDVLSRLTYP